MAYQNVATPRFYINVLEWLHNIDMMTIDNIYKTLPVKVKNIRDLVLAVLESDRITLQKQRTAMYPSSLFG